MANFPRKWVFGDFLKSWIFRLIPGGNVEYLRAQLFTELLNLLPSYLFCSCFCNQCLRSVMSYKQKRSSMLFINRYKPRQKIS